MKICCRTWLSHTSLLHWSGLMSESQQGPEICDVISRKRSQATGKTRIPFNDDSNNKKIIIIIIIVGTELAGETNLREK